MHQCHSDHASVICDQDDGLCSFIPARLIIANENVDLPYFGGSWSDC